MCGADVGDDSEIGFSAAGETFNLPRSAHAHLQNHRLGLRLRLQKREGDTDVVVVVRRTGMNQAEGREGTTDQFPGCGLPGGSGHRDNRAAQLTAMQAGQLLIGLQGVLNMPVQQPCGDLAGSVMGHHRCHCTETLNLGQKTVGIKAFPDQGNEQTSRHQRSGVCADRTDGLIGCHGSTLWHPPQVTELAGAKRHDPELSSAFRRIMPLPTRAERPSS